ncbi:MAG: endonuclease MutS2 [Oscillospiraceae bacterium]|jgi:DNA mismatch repair protein MutS2|nr:endonuclease MutS2 [Oscillospiraceae bacterium]
MQQRTLRVLEFTKIIQTLCGLAVSELGAEACAALEPSNDIETVRASQEETEEALVLLTYLPHHPLIPFADVRPAIRLAAIGATLSPRALLDVAGCMRAARAARDVLVTDRANTPRITAQASELSTFRRLEEDIMEAILGEEEISDHASPELYAIRRHIRQCNERVREKLNSMIHSAAFSKHLQDPIITIRNDRYVIPVKQESRASVPGLIHDQSASGATLFVEPMAVVEIGNDLKQWIAKEKNEIERILQALSARVRPEAELLTQNLEVLARLDFLFAKGLLSRQMRAVSPKINERGYIRIVRGRHPLIDPEQVVPIDLWMGEDFTTLIITGPNTGGKTVTLKTVGLFTLMAQAGLQVPADLGSELAVFDEVFADIGDEQSIEQSLSTFSSHMTNIVSVMGSVTPKSLALFDELGAGTDPTEGAALAQAILRRLLGLKTRTLATTHYSELKAFALTTEGVENASAEFNVETLRPTYRLSIGIPGKSNAFEISRRLGLDEGIIGDAKELLSRDQIRFEDVIANAEYHRKVAERERELAEAARLDMVRTREMAEQEREKFLEAREVQLAKAREEARRIVEKARQESEGVIAELRRMKKDGGGLREHEIQAVKKRIDMSAGELADALKQPIDTALAPPKDLKLGESVLLTHLNTKGTVLSAPDGKGEVLVQAGILKLKVHVSQLKRDKAAQKPLARAHADIDMTTRTVKLECDLRGMNLEEAIEAVDKYLDDAVLSSLGEVYIIHGKGTGTLRTGVKEHLRRHPHVKSYRAGKYGEGEDGVTVVTLQ